LKKIDFIGIFQGYPPLTSFRQWCC